MLHILAGQYKGRRLLPPPAGAGTRPMTGAVRKSVFDTLSAWLEGAMVLDLYCGTGTIGLEALSRGAGRCCFAERDRLVLERLRRNIEAVGAQDRSAVWAGDIPCQLASRLGTLDRPADLVFVDPPYAQARDWEWATMVDQVFAPLAAGLEAQGVLVLRLPSEVPPPGDLAGLTLKRARGRGGMAWGFYQRPKVED